MTTTTKNKTFKIKLFAIFLLMMCAAGTCFTRPVQAASLRVIYNNDNIGELDSCG